MEQAVAAAKTAMEQAVAAAKTAMEQAVVAAKTAVAPAPGETEPGNNVQIGQPFRSVVIPNGNGSLIASFICERDFSEALFTLHVDENTDFTCDRIWQDDAVSIKSIDIKPVEGKGNAPECEIAPDKRSVKVTGLVAKANYEVQVKYDAPQELASTVGLPVLRLELHTPVQQKSKP